jgi:ribosome-binding factor A
MESTRQSKINRLLQKDLSDIFLLQTKAVQGVMISVSAVRVSPDLSVARVYLSIFPSDKGPDILKEVKTMTKTIRYDLSQRVRFQLRKVPQLVFFIDDSLDYIDNIDQLLKQ